MRLDQIVSKGEEGSAKLQLLTQYCADHDLDLNNCLAVGDSRNDIPLFTATGHSVTFTWCRDEVKAAAQHTIKDITDLVTLLP